MPNHWQQWALDAQSELKRQKVINHGLWAALVFIARTGFEPYHSVKYEVLKMREAAP